MKINEIIHPWPPNVHRFEQTFYGISMITVMGGGLGGIVVFVAVSQIFAGLGGMIGGGIAGVIMFLTIALCMTPLEVFHDMVLPKYIYVRYQVSKSEEKLELPLIVSSGGEAVVIGDWDGNDEVVIE